MTLAMLPDLITRLEQAVCTDLAHAIDNLETLRGLNAHTARGFDTWHAYVVDRFGELLAQLKLPRTERVALAASMAEAGMSVRAVAERLGVSVGTVHNYRAELGKVTHAGPRQPVPVGRVYVKAITYLTRAHDGLTLVELAKVSGWTEGSSSGVLTYLLRRGWAVRSEERRAGQRVHQVTELGAGVVA